MIKENVMLPKRIHFTGICGVAISAIAIAFHKAGVKVTGSDKGFFPPVSTALEEAGISFYAGWHPEKMIESGIPDFILAATASGTQNPETAYARERSIPIKSDAEVRGEYFAKGHSIVCAGTWGKTSSTALLAHILLTAGLDPSWMIGGISLSTDAAHLGSSDWSVIEGDEYKSSPWDNRPKFEHLHGSHILLTAVSWDHADLYPTEESYFDAFKKLVSEIPAEGLIIANMDQSGVSKTVMNSNKRIVTYGTGSDDYSYSNVNQSKDGLKLTISHAGESFEIASQLLGTFQAENITGCFAMAHEVGIPADTIIAAIASFKGMKRRLEKRLDGDITVIDDIAHSPEKASSILKNLHEIYPGKVFAIFEPNIGGRRIESIAKYDNAFKDADTIIIPRLTKLKVAEHESGQPLEGDALTKAISKTHPNAVYMDDDAKLVDFLVSNAKKGDVIAFLGSHGFRGMIEETVKRISNS